MSHGSSPYRTKELTQRAASLFEWIYFKGKVKALFAPLTGQSRTIPFLSDTEVDMSQLTVEQVGLQPIRVDRIIGTLGRMNYDREFYPLQHRDKKRWMSVAIAMMSDVTVLAPISVIQIEDDYYTSDGNHRVSVARTLNKLYIDANVTRWTLPT